MGLVRIDAASPTLFSTSSRWHVRKLCRQRCIQGDGKAVVRLGCEYLEFVVHFTHSDTEMLTPIDQPLDKLQDLDQEEM